MLPVFVLPVLEYCSAVWCSAANTHPNLLDRAVRGARFLTGRVFECDIAHCRSVAVFCMLYKIRCNPMHLLNDALPGPHVPVQVTCNAQVAHRHTYMPLHSRTSEYNRTFVPLSVSLWNDLADPVFNGMGLAGFKSRQLVPTFQLSKWTTSGVPSNIPVAHCLPVLSIQFLCSLIPPWHIKF